MAKTRTEIQATYDASHRKTFSLKLHNDNDADIIEKLTSVPSMQGYIKQLIRKDISRSVPEKGCDSVPVLNKCPVVLHENKKGIKIIREDGVKRSKVKVIGLNGTPVRIYRFNNCPEYKHPYLSWENLDHCGGWASDDSYLLSAVQEGKKPAAQYAKLDDPVPEIKPDKSIVTYYKSEQVYNHIRNQVYIARSCTLNDLFDIDDIINAYQKQDVYLNKDQLIPYLNKPIMDLMKEDFWINANSVNELVITGLMLGYPIESTASILCGY